MTDSLSGYTPVNVSRLTNYDDHPWRATREAAEWARALSCTIEDLPDELLRVWKRIDWLGNEVWAFHALMLDVPDDSIPRILSAAAAQLSDPLLSVEAVMRRAGAHVG
ncbi:hypothetical protein [Jannaschia sp. R86511]|uniref:hypothetical protein n=1 Tax=Jannaschia sp. R86511 TaxID=3093853 RepID=UPI0036D27874